MTWIVLTIVAVLVGLFGLFLSIGGQTPSERRGGIATVVVTVAAWAILTLVFSIENIAQRQVGIVYSFSGTIAGQRGPSTTMIFPWQHVNTENTGIQREDFSLDANNSAVSSDQQEIFAELSLNYEVDPQHVLNLYRTVGPNWKSILLDSRVLQDFKEVTSTFTAEQITTKREQLRRLTKARLVQELAPYDITVVDFFVKNLGYTQSYQSAINAKNQQVQQALQAQAKVAQAKAEADQVVAAAKGQAKAIRLQGEALRENPDYLQLQAINKLAPHASVIICTASSCPSFLPSSSTQPSGASGR